MVLLTKLFTINGHKNFCTDAYPWLNNPIIEMTTTGYITDVKHYIETLE